MAKIGQARVLDDNQFQSLLAEIRKHRHSEKNTLIMQISFKLGLRAQEIALLRVTEVAQIGSLYTNGFEIKDVLVLPKSFTKGARPGERSVNTKTNVKEVKRRSVRFSLSEFDRIVAKIVTLATSGVAVNPKRFYPAVNKTGGKTRELPLADRALRLALSDYLRVRFVQNSNIKLSDPLIMSQKRKPYSSNTLQEHMATMLRKWAGIDRASSHSGRRTLATKLLHDQREHLKTVQLILGHKDASTTVIYDDIPEKKLKSVLHRVGASYND